MTTESPATGGSSLSHVLMADHLSKYRYRTVGFAIALPMPAAALFTTRLKGCISLSLPRADVIVVPVVHRRQKKGNWKRSWEPFGSVQCIAIPKADAQSMTKAHVYNQVSEMALGYLKAEEREKLDQIAAADTAEIETAAAAACLTYSSCFRSVANTHQETYTIHELLK